MFPTVLIVDDEPSILKSLSGILSDEGFEVITAANGYEGLKIIDKEPPDLVLLDIWMPGIDGIETLKEIKKNNAFIHVIIITGHGTIETAVKATKMGAFDFIEKPLSIDRVIVAINNALNFRRLEEENRYLRKKTIEKNSITGNSAAITALKKKIALAAPTDSWILITGENGTGKELIARTIHQFSDRADKPMVDVNCAIIPEELMESEFFGHEKGAHKGAVTRKIGKFELAGDGTIFLDEIGDMSLNSQAKILRALQELKFQRVGGSRTLQIKARIISSTNKNIENEIGKGKFREDLYYRLNKIPITAPPLRNRLEDIPLLVGTFLDECTRDNRAKRKSISPAALHMLARYLWPGNVRELKNLIERLAIMVETRTVEDTDIPAPYNSSAPEGAEFVDTSLFGENSLREAKEKFEREFIRRKVAEFDNDLARTAKEIGVGQSYLRKKTKLMDS
ncbi:MAG: sigma-54 dependent transcriptional regulator [Desulfobacterales bacterium]|nr:sigma-54 dependent transcriptional regulator [Desulfobacterales bacterium]